jgi:mannosyl-3-phosphoglycerate phosphatase
MKTLVIFTDLDGTLLDEHYSFEPAKEALEELQRRDIPLVLCSSKTRAEIEHYRSLLKNSHPFVAENGGGVFIQKGYFKEKTLPEGYEQRENYILIRLGADYKILRDAIKKLQQKGYRIKGFGDMSPEEISRLTGLAPSEALLAMKREFDEPFILLNGEKRIEQILKEIEEMGLRYTKGRIYHLLGASDKGKAIRVLKELYKKHLGDVLTVALGDSPNDLEMLQAVEVPVVVKRPDGTIDETLASLKDAIFTEYSGPAGWNRTLRKLLTKL